MSVTDSPGKPPTGRARRSGRSRTHDSRKPPAWPGASCCPAPTLRWGSLPGSGEESRGEFVVQFSVEVAFQVTAVTLGEFLRNGVRNCDAFGYGHAVADLAEHAGQRNI